VAIFVAWTALSFRKSPQTAPYIVNSQNVWSGSKTNGP